MCSDAKYEAESLPLYQSEKFFLLTDKANARLDAKLAKIGDWENGTPEQQKAGDRAFAEYHRAEKKALAAAKRTKKPKDFDAAVQRQRGYRERRRKGRGLVAKVHGYAALAKHHLRKLGIKSSAPKRPKRTRKKSHHRSKRRGR